MTSMALELLHDARGRSGAAPTSTRSGGERRRWDDPLLYALAFVVGLVPIVAVLVRGGTWGAEPTVGVLFCVFSGAGLVRHAYGTYFAAPRGRDTKNRSGS